MSDQQTRLEAVLGWLRDGRITAEEAARRIRTMHFPQAPGPQTPWDRIIASDNDPEPPEPGSFFAVSQAFARGEITKEQYAILAQAAAEAMHADREAAAAREQARAAASASVVPGVPADSPGRGQPGS